MTVFFILAMCVFNAFFVMILNQSGQFKLADFFHSPFGADNNFSQDYSAYSSQASVFGTTPIDVEIGGEAGETGFIIIDNAALLNTNNPISNVVPTREGVLIYKVQKGDTVSRIAANFGISVNTILWANGDLLPNALKPGQEIVVLSDTGVLHRIEEGEHFTIFQIGIMFRRRELLMLIPV